MSEDVVSRSDSFDAQVRDVDVGREIKRLTSYGHTNRVLIFAVVLLALVVAWVVGQVVVNKNNIHQTCVASNASRADQRQLWNFVIELTAQSPRPDRTPEQARAGEEQLRLFRRYLDTTFAPRDCSSAHPFTTTTTNH